MPLASEPSIAPLLTAEGWALLQELPPYQESEALHLNESLRKAGYSPELITAAITQSRLRAKAQQKFGEFAQNMLFTAPGLEQATRLPVAARHAHRFQAVGIRHVTDLGCGIGADALACASLDISVTAVEQDEITAACATINLSPFPQATVMHADATTVNLENLTEHDGVWLDPARRTTSSSGTRRIWDPEAFSPPLSFAEDLADRGLALGVKLGPGTPRESLPGAAEAQWLSVEGDLVELTLWFNRLARPEVQRAATVISGGAVAELTSTQSSSPTGPDGALADYLYEPDPAIIRSQLLHELLEKCSEQSPSHLLDSRIAYFTTEQPLHTPFARGYRIREVLPYQFKTLRSWVQAEGITALTIKKRGIQETPEQIRAAILPKRSRNKTALPQKNSAEAPPSTMIVTRSGNKRLAIMADPLT